MCWEGRYYDTSLIYAYRPERSNCLVPYAPVACPTQSFVTSSSKLIEFVKTVTYHNMHHSRSCATLRIAHQDANSACNKVASKHHNSSYPYRNTHFNSRTSAGWQAMNERDFIEINLGYPRLVTHIGTAGKRELYQYFPTITKYLFDSFLFRRIS